MEDYGWIIFIIFVIAGWALIYAFVVERRRRRDAEESGARVTLLERQIEGLRQHLEKLQRLPADSVAPQPAPAVAMQAPALPPAPPVCAKCGYKLQPGFEFCIRCGSRVEHAKPVAQPIAGALVPPERPGASLTL